MRAIPHKLFLFGPLLLMALGFTSNALVMAANGGTMPVLEPACSAEDFAGEIDAEGMQVHSCMTASTHLKALADWIVLRHLGIASPGDFLEWAFEITFRPAFLIWCVLVIIRKPYAERP